MMDYFASPAMLGGIITCVALGAWALGRWHGAAAPDLNDSRQPAPAPPHPPFEWRAPDSRSSDPATPCQQAARAEREVALEAAPSLGDLHAEISAYRQREQVFADVGDDAVWSELSLAGARRDCRYLGLIGQPTCAMPEAALSACGCSSGCPAAPASTRAGRVVQLSAAASSLTRV